MLCPIRPTTIYDIALPFLDNCSTIELIFPYGATAQIKPLSLVRGITCHGKRPIAFKWHHPQLLKASPKLIDWIYHEFIPIFDTNAFLWKVSIHTAPKELQCHLLGLSNN